MLFICLGADVQYTYVFSCYMICFFPKTIGDMDEYFYGSSTLVYRILWFWWSYDDISNWANNIWRFKGFSLMNVSRRDELRLKYPKGRSETQVEDPTRSWDMKINRSRSKAGKREEWIGFVSRFWIFSKWYDLKISALSYQAL